MSFELYMQCYDHGLLAGTPVDAVRGLFTNIRADSAPDDWHLWYDDANNCHVEITRQTDYPDRVESLVVWRPCQDSRLWDSLYRLLELGPWVLFFPADPSPLVMANRSHAEHLPADMRESLGPVCEVKSGNDILRIIHEE